MIRQKSSRNLFFFLSFLQLGQKACLYFRLSKLFASGFATVVEQSPHHLKIEGSCSVAAAGTKNERAKKKNRAPSSTRWRI